MKLLGTVRTVQIQKESLKVGENPNRRYDPGPIQPVAQIRVTRRGVFGLHNGSEIIDVHHMDHPNSRNRKGSNGLSLNFFCNYERIRMRYAYVQEDYVLEDGKGGENLLIQQVPDFRMDWIDSRLLIELPGGQQLHLEDVMATAPCEPFSKYITNNRLSGRDITEVLRFLADGTRGFYTTLATTDAEQEYIVGPGAKLYAI